MVETWQQTWQRRKSTRRNLSQRARTVSPQKWSICRLSATEGDRMRTAQANKRVWGGNLHRGFESRPLHWRRLDCSAAQTAPVAQLDRASVYGTEGQRFESSRARLDTGISPG